MQSENNISFWRKVFTPIHQWSGLLTSWILFIVFLGGTLSVFHTELDYWFKPELPHITQDNNIIHSVDTGLQFLQENAPNADRWQINFPNKRNPFIEVSWSNKGERHHRLIASDQPIPMPRETEGGSFFTDLHHELHYLPKIPIYFFLTIIASIGLITLISGIIIHRRIFIDFFNFRNKPIRRWLDLHTLFGILPLPFHLMIIYTGIVVLGIHGVMMFGATKKYPNTLQFYENLSFLRMPEKGNLAHKPLPPIDKYIQSGLFYWNNDDLRLISINNPNTDKAKLTIVGASPHQISRFAEFKIYDLHTGVLLKDKRGYSWGENLFGGTVALHIAVFADYPVLWLYFLCGIAGTILIATGTFSWIYKRLYSSTSAKGVWWVQRLNLSIIGGFPLSCLSYFYANRLLPIDTIERAKAEGDILFILWLILTLWCFLYRSEFEKKWRNILKITSICLFILPLIDWVMGHSLLYSLKNKDWIYLSLELVALILGFIYWKLYTSVKVGK